MAGNVRRPLNDRERSVLTFLLDAPGLPEREIIEAQVQAATVTGYCRCGCPSVQLMIDSDRASVASTEGSPIADAHWDAGGGGVLLFSTDGWLSYLEVLDDRRAAV